MSEIALLTELQGEGLCCRFTEQLPGSCHPQHPATSPERPPPGACSCFLSDGDQHHLSLKGHSCRPPAALPDHEHSNAHILERFPQAQTGPQDKGRQEWPPPVDTPKAQGRSLTPSQRQHLCSLERGFRPGLRQRHPFHVKGNWPLEGHPSPCSHSPARTLLGALLGEAGHVSGRQK